MAKHALAGPPPTGGARPGTVRGQRALAALVTVCLGAVGLIVAGPAHAATAPPWEPDPNAVGSLSFYDAAGNVITSGRTDVAPFAAYVAGSATVRAGDKSAAVYFANPQPGKTPVAFFREQVGTFTGYPTKAAPATVNTVSSTRPVNTGDSGDQSLDGFEKDSIISTDAGYQNVVQVRLRTADAAGQIGVPYEAADVVIDPTAHTWTQIYRAPTSVAAPAAPTNVTASPGTQSAKVSWTAPANNGGSPITGYRVEYSADGGATYTPVSENSSATTATITGLTNGTSYVFRVSAVNSVGTGAVSAPSAAVTPVADVSALAIGAPGSVRYGYTATITARLSDTTTRAALRGQPITLYGRHGKTGRWSTLKTVTTTSTGAASVGLKPTSYEQFYWHYAGTASHRAVSTAAKAVGVSQVVAAKASAAGVKHGATVKIYGTVGPVGTNQKVYLQALVGRTWKTVTSATIKRQKLPNRVTTTGYVLSVTVARKGSFRYRVDKPATSTLLVGYSATITVKAS